MKKDYTIDDLTDILSTLRSENGCPWDRVQTHDTIKKHIIEEGYEVIDALERGDDAMFANELGDLLLQVVFHSQIAVERGAFDFGDVVNEICRKLISRHTHVFGEDKAVDAAQALNTWDDNKRKEKGELSVAESMRDVPAVFPSLMRAEKIQKKAAKVGFDWPDISGAIAKTHEEVDELSAAITDAIADAIASEESNFIREEYGDLLFSLVNVGRFLKLDPEEALRRATDKFINRFEILEQLAQENQEKLSNMTLEELDSLWEQAKSKKIQ